MLIVTQNKKEVVNLSSIEAFMVSGYDVLALSSCSEALEWKLGTYETNQKSNVVLQSIWSAYANGDKVFLMP